MAEIRSKTLAERERERERQEVARAAAEKANYEKRAEYVEEQARQTCINNANTAAILRKGLINTEVYFNDESAVKKKKYLLGG